MVEKAKLIDGAVDIATNGTLYFVTIELTQPVYDISYTLPQNAQHGFFAPIRAYMRYRGVSWRYASVRAIGKLSGKFHIHVLCDALPPDDWLQSRLDKHHLRVHVELARDAIAVATYCAANAYQSPLGAMQRITYSGDWLPDTTATNNRSTDDTAGNTGLVFEHGAVAASTATNGNAQHGSNVTLLNTSHSAATATKIAFLTRLFVLWLAALLVAVVSACTNTAMTPPPEPVPTPPPISREPTPTPPPFDATATPEPGTRSPVDARLSGP